MSDFRQMLKKKEEDLEFAPIDRRALRVAPVKTALIKRLNWRNLKLLAEKVCEINDNKTNPIIMMSLLRNC